MHNGWFSGDIVESVSNEDLGLAVVIDAIEVGALTGKRRIVVVVEQGINLQRNASRKRNRGRLFLFLLPCLVDYCIRDLLLYWKDAFLNTLDDCIGRMHLSIH